MLKCSHHSGCDRPAVYICKGWHCYYELSCDNPEHRALIGNNVPLDDVEGQRLLAEMTASKLRGDDPLDFEIPF